jgi:predicted nucleic acid-binding protein
VILVDTSVLVGALTGARSFAGTLESIIDRGYPLGLCAPVLYEWRRGPRVDRELAIQEALLPSDVAWPFGPAEVLLAADLYRRLRRGRQRELDFAIAACALTRAAALWTLNARDFADIPELTLFDPAARS